MAGYVLVLLHALNTLADARDHKVTGCFGNRPASFFFLFSSPKVLMKEWNGRKLETSPVQNTWDCSTCTSRWSTVRSTLRYLIEEGLHGDKERIWRLFREIVEGLVHIHSQVMHKRLISMSHVWCNLLRFSLVRAMFNCPIWIRQWRSSTSGSC